MTTYSFDILALDVATTLGWARGRIGDSAPVTGSITFHGPDGASEAAVLGNCLEWLSEFLRPEPRPHLLVLEALLPVDALPGETNRATRDRLCQLHGVIKAVANRRGIFDIKLVDVQRVRQHFVGNRFAKKDEVRERCRELRWPVAGHDAADAAACWDYAVCLADPTIGIKRAPLFRGVVR